MAAALNSFSYLAVSEVCRDVHGRQRWLVDLCVVVRVNADLLPPQVEGVGAMLDRLELVVRLEVGEAPQTAVNDVRESLLLRNLRRRKKDGFYDTAQ